MNALTRVPCPYFEPADGDLLNQGLATLWRSLAGRQTSYDALMALGVQLDKVLAAAPDETAREHLEMIGNALDVDISRETFCAVIKRRLRAVEDDFIADHRRAAVAGESPLERPTPNAWCAIDEAAYAMIQDARNAMVAA